MAGPEPENWTVIYHRVCVLLALVLLPACGGDVEGSEPTAAKTYDVETGVCFVPYEDITCEFVCADCADPETGEYREGSCENAMPTALDVCSFQYHHPNGYEPDAE